MPSQDNKEANAQAISGGGISPEKVNDSADVVSGGIDNAESDLIKQSYQRVSYYRRIDRRMEDQQESPIWLISFADIMALMLTFFVLLFATSTPREEEWAQFTDTIQQNFNAAYGQTQNQGIQDGVTVEKVNFSQALDLRYLSEILAKLVEKEPSLKVVKIINQRGSLIISLPQTMLFETGQASVRTEASKSLFILAETLSRIKNRIEVVGHTDPRPITSGAYESNWHLSLARASNVAGVLENVGYTKNIIVRGQAAGRYQDIPVAMSEVERLDLSRRVDIVIMEDDGKRLELFKIGQP